MSKRVRRSAFTLPEVLVTVTVVAVLAAVVVPAVTQYVNRGNSPATQQDVEQLQNAVNGYVADNRGFPGYISTLASVAGHGPYLSAQVTSATGQTNATGNTSFTSGGLGIAFADSIDHPTGYLSLFVVSASTPCARLLSLDSLYDTHDGNGAGRVQWTNGSPVCDATHGTGNYSGATFKFMTVGQ